MNGNSGEGLKALVSVILGLVAAALIAMLLDIDIDNVPRLILIVWWLVNAHIIHFILK